MEPKSPIGRMDYLRMTQTVEKILDREEKNKRKKQKKDKVSDSILIHVFDQNRGINRDFTCLNDHLDRYMHYFKPYLKETGNYNDIDISVHCDVKIFEWLLTYV